MLVWKAMPSITPTMSPMRFELWVMRSIVWTTSFTTAPPWDADAEAAVTSALAFLADSEVWWTVVVSCSMVAAVS